MRTTLAFVVAVLLVMPSYSFADAQKPCIPGTVQTRSYSWASVGVDGIKSGLKDEARRLVSRNDKCSDEQVMINGGITTTVTVCATRLCKTDADRAKYGCAKGQKPPTLLFGAPDKGYIPINKCHKNSEITSAIERTIDGANEAPLVELANRQPQYSPPPSVAATPNAGTDALSEAFSGGAPPSGVDTSTDAGRTQLAKELAAGAGISESKAKEI